MFYFILVISAIIILISMLRSHHFVKSMFLSVFQGITAMFAVNFIGEMINVHIPMNWFSLSIGTIGGLPGIIFLLINDILIKI